MTRPDPSPQLRNPFPEKDDEGRKIYIALLERRNLMLTHQNTRLRACLERATGEQWDNTEVADLSAEQMDEIVAQDIARGLRMSVENARAIVVQNKAMANPTQLESHASA